MDARIGEWIIDFMNMIFGPAENEETRDFWEQVLFPELYSHYNYMIRERLKCLSGTSSLFSSPFANRSASE